jgi:hypothetical protein
MNKTKKFDAVKMMRSIRNRLSDQYNKNPDLQYNDLQKIRIKYNFKVDSKTKS